MKILCNSDQSNLDKIRDLAYAIEDLLNKEGISRVELWDYKQYNDLPVAEIDIKITGDWKHDHLRADYLVKENFIVFKVDTVSLEDTGEDWGPELHQYFVSIK